MNLITTITQKPNINRYQSNSQERKDAKQNVFAPIPTLDLIKPDRPQKSYIVKDPFYMAPINFVTDIKENIVNIAKATTGKANDHDLGRINDFSMKAGALALAAYLFTHGRTSIAKSMEFIGFGSFFASMALWPKLFIETPLKAMYGLNIHQKYVDNEGRKKMFFQDPQYIPWDLYSDSELSKLGDRLGVPRDIHNRNEVIKKKAHKIALQGNTLWMLTAGFATPLMSALMCNGIEKIITPRSERATFPNNIFGAFASSIENMRKDKVERKLSNMENISKSKSAKLDQSALSSFLRVNKGEELTDEMVKQIMSVVHKYNDILAPEVVETQVRALSRPVEIAHEATPEYVEKFIKECETNLAKDLSEEYQHVWKTYFHKNKIKQIAGNKIIDAEDFVDKLRCYLYEEEYISNDVRDAFTNFINKVERLIEPVSNSLTKEEALGNIKVKRFIDEDFTQKLLQMDRKLYEFSIRRDVLDEYMRLYLGDVGDSVIANRSINATTAFFNSLGYTKQELSIARNNGVIAEALLQKKLEELVADDKKYQKAIRSVQKAVLDFDRAFMPDAQDGSIQGMKKEFFSVIDKFVEQNSKFFEESGLNVLKERLIGDAFTEVGSMKANMVDSVTRRIDGIRNDLYKLIYTLDFFKRASGLPVENLKDSKHPFVLRYKDLIKNQYKDKLKPEFTDEKFFEDLQKYKRIVLGATIGDATEKYNMQNPQTGLYRRLMELIYSRSLDPKTNAALEITESGDVYKLGDIDFSQSLKRQMQKVFDNLGNFRYNHATSVGVYPEWTKIADPLERDSLLGERIASCVKKAASNAYNSSKWMGIFGTMSIALVGVTLLAQVFFGKLDKKELQYVRKDK